MRRISYSTNPAQATPARPYEPPRLEKLGKISQDTKGVDPTVGLDIEVLGTPLPLS
jgi:hypothetical protein